MDQPAEDFYRVKLDNYAGPLDLLLYLIDREEMDIRDIPIVRITEQYLEFVQLIRDIDLSDAGDFLVMATRLMEVKSRMLLPRALEEEEEVSSDPREELIQHLIQYRSMKARAVLLEERFEETGRRFQQETPREKRRIGDPLKDAGVWDLLTAYSRLAEQIETPDLPIMEADHTPVQDHMNRILELLTVTPDDAVPFERVFPTTGGRSALLGTFLALLELIRVQKIAAIQEETYGPIFIRLQMLSEPVEEAFEEE